MKTWGLEPAPARLRLWKRSVNGQYHPAVHETVRAALFALNYERFSVSRRAERPGSHSPHPTVLHALHRLADFPVLAALASERTEAATLDGRACRSIYEAALARIDWQEASASERAFMLLLSIEV